MSTEFKLSAIPTIRRKLFGQGNYEEWRNGILRLARMLELEGILDGSITKPDSTSSSSTITIRNDSIKWLAADARLASIIEFNCEDRPASLIAGLSTSADMWTALEVRYKDKTSQNLSSLLAQVITHKHGTGNETLDDHIKDFDLRWNRLSTACAGTYKDGTKEFALQRLTANDELKASVFMATLPPSFNDSIEVLRATPDISYADVITRIRDARTNNFSSSFLLVGFIVVLWTFFKFLYR